MSLIFEGEEHKPGEGTSLFERETQQPPGKCYIMLTPLRKGGIVLTEHSARRGTATMTVPPGGDVLIPYRSRNGRPIRVTGK